MKRNTILMLGIMAACSITTAFAQEEAKENEVTVSAQIRTRAEYRNGALSPRSEGTSPAGFVNERARIGIGYKRKGLEMKFSAQHVGVWGQDALVDKSGRFILNEAWAKMALSDDWFIQLGRQSLSYDDERILGGLDWNVAGRYHDALKIGYEKGGHKLHGIFAFNQNDENTNGGSYYDNSTTKLYKNMQTIWYHYQSQSAPFGISLLAMNLGQETGEDDDPNTKYMQTFGTHITYNPGIVSLTGSFYYQSGKNSSSRKVSAYMGSIKAGFKVSPIWTINIGEDYLSGSNSSDGTYKAFDPLYGTHHKFYGAMDYFYASTFVTGYAPGLSDTQIGLSCKTSKAASLSLNYHYFATGVKLEGLKRTLGSEIDIQIDWKIKKDITFQAGYSTMFGSSTMDTVKGGSHDSWQDWAWVSLNISPSMLFKF